MIEIPIKILAFESVKFAISTRGPTSVSSQVLSLKKLKNKYGFNRNPGHYQNCLIDFDKYFARNIGELKSEYYT